MATTELTTNTTLFMSDLMKTEVIHKLSETASKIALKNFDGRFTTMVYFNATLSFCLQMFLNSYKKSVVIGRGTFYPKFVAKTRQFVLFGSGLANIKHILKWMQDHEFYNTGKYIIVCQSLDDECNEANATQMFWEYKIVNVIFLKSVENEVVGFTYFPLSNYRCIYDKPISVNLACLSNESQECDFFQIKLTNLNACPFTVSTFIQLPLMKIVDGKPSGTDGDLLRVIAEKLNGTLNVMTPKMGNGWGQMGKNGTWSGSLGDVYYDFANFSMTSGALTLTRFSYFHLSTSYNAAYVIWVAHSPKIIPSSLKLSYPFQENARIALGVSFAVVVVCSLMFQSKLYLEMSRKLKLKRPHSSVVFYSWMICMGLGVPTSRLPKKAALLNIVLLWMWYCLLVRTFYQVSLISAMKSNYYYDVLEHVETAIEEGYTFGGGASLKDYYIDYPLIYENWQDVETHDIIPTLRKVSQGEEFVLAMAMLTARTIIWNEKIKVQMLPEKIVTSPSVIFFKKYSPLADAVNLVLDRINEAGLSAKFLKDYAPVVVNTSEDALESIKLEHYTGCYALLITGWIVSYLVFVGEIIFERIFRTNLIIIFKN